MNRPRFHPNFEIAEAVIKIDGYFSSWDLEQQDRMEWRNYGLINARPERIKLCPICYRRLPIAEFLIDDQIHTLVKPSHSGGEEFAYLCANISEYCRSCGQA
jgi:hypothetical protein